MVRAIKQSNTTVWNFNSLVHGVHTSLMFEQNKLNANESLF